MTRRPRAPEEFSGVRRAPDLEAWIRSTFIEPGAALENLDHDHLRDARIGCLWAGEEWVRGGRRILGLAAIPRPPLGSTPWARALFAEQEFAFWGGDPPDFVLTFSAPWALEATDAEFCAVVDHELYHCAIAVDEFESPRFSADGSPRWAIRGHDVEEFLGVVRRYGVAASGVAEIVEAARSNEMRIDLGAIRAACGVG